VHVGDWRLATRTLPQLSDQARPVQTPVPHADDAAAAHVDTGFAHVGQRIETILAGPGTDAKCAEDCGQ
jgi:hypothetical protein